MTKVALVFPSQDEKTRVTVTRARRRVSLFLLTPGIPWDNPKEERMKRSTATV
ncbi:hypothetical protein KY348_04275 [Candidatus Woesearchaeota archaeon]|nr:hypothetical protein [Candidatus Woesearchaeota archaeon]